MFLSIHQGNSRRDGTCCFCTAMDEPVIIVIGNAVTVRFCPRCAEYVRGHYRGFMWTTRETYYRHLLRKLAND